MSSPELTKEGMKLEAEYLNILSSFEDVFKKYHQAILLQPLVPSNQDNLQSLYEGLKSLQLSFDNIKEAFQALCETRGIVLT